MLALRLNIGVVGAACALLVAAPAAEGAKRPSLVAVEHAGASALMLRWSAAIRHSGVPTRAFDVRAGTRRVGVRAVRRGPRPEILRLVLARSAAVTHVRYRGATKAVRGTDSRAPAAEGSRPTGPAVATTADAAAGSRLTSAPAGEVSQASTSAEVPAAAEPAAPAPWSTLRPPILYAQHELMPFGARSFWLQPWRAYLDTVPGSVLRDAVGVNFNVGREDAARAAQQLAAAGVRRARVEFGWDSMRYDDPAQLADPGKVDAILGALGRNGIRPLLLLNAHHGAPGPVIHHSLRVVEPARAGARSVRLDAASVVPGRTGFNALDGSYKAADVLVTAVAPDGTAALSKPLPRDLAAGIYPGATLRFAPFAPPRRADGIPNPAFEATLAGWLRYAGAITRRAREVLGGDAFDVEIWNELSFGSDFLDAGRYYDPLPEPLRGDGDVPRAILERTVAFLRDGANGVAGIGIGDGFASELPWPSGATEPAGVTAIDKHPYPPVRDYPEDLQHNTTAVGPDGRSTAWTPRMRAFFPEFWLSGLQTETLVRDLAPATTFVYGTPHGRHTRPAGGAPPQLWVTETGLDLADERLPQAELTSAAKRHIQTKGVLRTLLAHVNKGVTALHLYAARGEVYGLLGDDGETLAALARATAPFVTSQPLSSPRSLTLHEVADRHDHVQFAGDGAGHPPLYDRDVVAVLPFQLSDRRFAIGAYVMTRDIAELHRPTAPREDVTRWDLPAASFRLTLGGLHPDARLTASNPLTGEPVPVTVVSRAADEIVLELPLTDSPRIILVDES